MSETSDMEYCPATSPGYGRCYLARGHGGEHANAMGCWDSGRVTAPMWERQARDPGRAVRDAPPDPRDAAINAALDAFGARLFALTSAILGSGRGADCAIELSEIELVASDLRAGLPRLEAPHP